MAINSLSTQLKREIEVEKIEQEINQLRQRALEGLQEKAYQADMDEE